MSNGDKNRPRRMRMKQPGQANMLSQSIEARRNSQRSLLVPFKMVAKTYRKIGDVAKRRRRCTKNLNKRVKRLQSQSYRVRELASGFIQREDDEEERQSGEEVHLEGGDVEESNRESTGRASSKNASRAEKNHSEVETEESAGLQASNGREETNACDESENCEDDENEKGGSKRKGRRSQVRRKNEGNQLLKAVTNLMSQVEKIQKKTEELDGMDDIQLMDNAKGQVAEMGTAMIDQAVNYNEIAESWMGIRFNVDGRSRVGRGVEKYPGHVSFSPFTMYDPSFDHLDAKKAARQPKSKRSFSAETYQDD